MIQRLKALDLGSLHHLLPSYAAEGAMPTRPNQEPPDLRYFNQQKK